MALTDGERGDSGEQEVSRPAVAVVHWRDQRHVCIGTGKAISFVGKIEKSTDAETNRPTSSIELLNSDHIGAPILPR